jgi:Arc/MetJ-type ribon-helix-helix transcriptional regulator
MKRITISVEDEQKQFIEEKSKLYGNRSGVVRAAIEQLRRREQIEEMQEHFREQGSEDEDIEKFSEQSWKNLPDY